MASKWFEVSVIAEKTIVIEIDEDCPRDLKEEAESEAMADATSYSSNVEVNMTRELTEKHQIDGAKRHADEIMPIN
jgi:hypothetical protein